MSKDTPKKPHGRPSLYSQEIADDICERLANGETLTSICKTEGMPDTSTVAQWARDGANSIPEFYPQYARARELGYQRMADEILDVADDGSNDWMDRKTRGGSIRVVDDECVKRSVLRVDTRKWLLSKALPKIYGDKLDVSAKHEAGDTFRALWEFVGAGSVGK